MIVKYQRLFVALICGGLAACASFSERGEEIVPDFEYGPDVPVRVIKDKEAVQLDFRGTIHPRKIRVTGTPSEFLGEPGEEDEKAAAEEPKDGSREVADAYKAAGSVREALAPPVEAPDFRVRPLDLTLFVSPRNQLDGTIAVSQDGYVVAADNTGIGFFREGVTLGKFTYPDFFEGKDVAFQFGDPKAIYDPEEDKFIFVLMVGAMHAERANLLVAFSKSDDPMDGWNLYTFNFWPDDLWLDYPGLSVNYKEVVVTGNLAEGPYFSGNIVYAFPKDDGYDDADHIHGLKWRDQVKGSSLFPVPSVREKFYGPGTYLLATNYREQTVDVYKLTGHLHSDPDLIVYGGPRLPEYHWQEPVEQANGVDLPTGDWRITGAYYQRRRIYFAFTKDDGNGRCGIAYNRLRLDDLDVTTRFFGGEGSASAYPALTNWKGYERLSSGAIAFLRAGPKTHPQVRVKFFDKFMHSTGDSILVQPGTTDSIFSTWGDYIGIQRRYGTKEAWLIGHVATPEGLWQSHVVKIALP